MKNRLLWPILATLALLVAACSDDEEAASPTATLVASPAAFERFDCTRSYPGTAPDATEFPKDIVDDDGNTVTFEAPPSAIASLSAGHTEILYAIGAGGQVSAVDNFSDCPAAAVDLPHVDAFTPSVEAIIALNADLVIVSYDPGDLRASLEGAGIGVLKLGTDGSFADVLDQIELLGDATGHPDDAEDLSAAMQSRADEISATYSGQDGPSVFHELDNTYYTAGPGSFIGDLYDTLGADNIANATGEPSLQMSNEAIIAAAPEVIILADEEFGESADTVAARPGWDAIPAVQDGRIYPIDPDIVSRPGPRLIEALETLAELLYPNLES